MTPTELIPINEARWKRATILPSRVVEARTVALRLVAPYAVPRYQMVEAATNVPWWVVAVIHEREADQDWSASLAQGDPWNRVSRHIPKGRGPFRSWHDAAIDALTKCQPYTAQWKDWSIGGTLTALELYNGLGYERYHSEPSPYDWGGTSIEQEGKYVADGIWSPHIWDHQLGSAAMLMKMMELDSSIKFNVGGEVVHIA